MLANEAAELGVTDVRDRAAGRDGGARRRDRPGPRRRRHLPARGRARATRAGTAGRREPRPGRASWPRPSRRRCRDTVRHIVTRTYTVEERLTLDVDVILDGRGRRRGLGAERGVGREDQAGADARGAAGHRRPAADQLRLRRRGLRHPDRLDRVRVLRRRAGRVAGGAGAAGGADLRARAVRPAAGDRAGLDRHDHGRRTARTTGCSAATAGGPRRCRPAPGSRSAAARSRCGSHGCTRGRSPSGWSRSSACPWTASAPSPAGWVG